LSKQATKAKEDLPAEQEQGEEKITLKKKKKAAKGEAAGLVIGSELGQKEYDIVKQMLQTICQNAAPLGKNIEYISDDIDSMSDEFKSWRKEYNEAH
jgi:hypothetical protein